MKEIKANTSSGDEGGKYFDPMSMERDEKGRASFGIARCCCGFELIKESDGTYRCSGGGHRYLMEEGDVIKDKFGNVLLRLPSGEEKKK